MRKVPSDMLWYSLLPRKVMDVTEGDVVAQARQPGKLLASNEGPAHITPQVWSHTALGTMSASEGSGRTSSTQFTPRLLQFVPGSCLAEDARPGSVRHVTEPEGFPSVDVTPRLTQFVPAA